MPLKSVICSGEACLFGKQVQNFAKFSVRTKVWKLYKSLQNVAALNSTLYFFNIDLRSFEFIFTTKAVGKTSQNFYK